MFDYLMGSTSLLEAVGDADSYADVQEEMDFLENVESIKCADDPEDAFDRINLETVENFHAIVNAITVDEFAHYIATNEEVVYEEGKLSEIGNSLKRFITNAWEKLKGVFEKVTDFIASKIRNDKKFLEKYEKDIIKCGTYKLDKGYDTKYYSVATSKQYLQRLKQAFASENGNLNLSIGPDSTSSSIGRSVNAKHENDTAEDCVKRIRSAVLGKQGGSLDADEFSKQLKSEILPDSTSNVMVRATDIIEEIKSAKVAKKAIKACYTDAQAFFAFMLKQAANLKSQAKTYDKKGYKDSDLASGIGRFTSIVKSCMTVATVIKKMQVKSINRFYAQARHAGVLMAREANKDVKDDSKDEPKTEGASMLESLMFI